MAYSHVKRRIFQPCITIVALVRLRSPSAPSFFVYSACSADFSNMYAAEKFLDPVEILINVSLRRLQQRCSVDSSPKALRKRGPTRQRNRAAGHEQLVKDYLLDNSTYTDTMFRLRYRITRAVFLRIVRALTAHDIYFVQVRCRHGKVQCAGYNCAVLSTVFACRN